ncbi:MAG TPA: vWA domain-containing protein [Herpetosiphonaceae bacterium]
MSRKIHREQGLQPIFADLHLDDEGKNLTVEVAFAIDPHIEKMAAAFYMDGSQSMQQAGNYTRARSFFSIALGKQRNPVQEAMQIIVPYITQKDADGVCRVAYWAAGREGKAVELIGELDSSTAASYKYHGPQVFGGGTHLLPALRDFVAYIQQLQQKTEVKAALAIVVTDGQIHDFDDLTRYTKEIANAIMAKKFPPANIVLVGVGESIDHEQMEQLGEVTPKNFTGRDIWCCAEAESVDDLPELVAHLLDTNTPAFWGGAVLKDERGTVLKTWEDMVPAVFEFTVPKTAKSFTLQVGSDVFTQTLEFPEEDH